MKIDLIKVAQNVMRIEADALHAVALRIDHQFVTTCQIILQCHGRTIVMGIGKSGHIGSKIAATLASTGTPAFFVHPTEASHGDLGMITAQDVVIALSNSGETDELLGIIPMLKHLKVPLIAITGNVHSTLAQYADVHLDVAIDQEACPLGLAPTASTTVTLAMGDALAVALLEARGFTSEDFARSHPGGKLGRRLLLTVQDVMLTQAHIPTNAPDDCLDQVLLTMTHKPVGLTVIVDKQQHVVGVFTEGDLRRALTRAADIHTERVAQCMTSPGLTIAANALAVTAVTMMEQHCITALPVLDEQQRLCGVIHMHHLLKARVL